MPVVITSQPQDSTVESGKTHTFSVSATGVNLTYQWYVENNAVGGALSDTFTTYVATPSNSYAPVFCVVTDTSDQTVESSLVALAISIPASGPYDSFDRHSLLWNYKNDTFTWKDPATEQAVDGKFFLFNSDFQTFGFVPGFQQRWEDFQSGAAFESTWTDAMTLQWRDTFSKGSDKEMIVISNGQVLRAEAQRNRAGSLKKYFAERTQIDFDGLSGEFRSGNIKQTKRFVMDVQGDQKLISRGSINQLDFYVGWSMNLMEDPNYKGPITFNLQARDFGGSYKVDYRSSGRYMGMYFDMTEAGQLSFTGGEVDVAQTSGR